MRPLASELIRRKRDGETLTEEELRDFLRHFMQGDVADYQISAFLMAVFFQGLEPAELSALTDAIIDSGRRLRFSDGGPAAVDKHSTGGVGDKVSLVLAPLVAAAGLRVPMISGRGLGHTGGTLDKLEAIPGFRTGLTLEEFEEILAEVGCAMIGQTPEIAPLDGRLYALRDVTGTVESVPLIASSIVSKKVAEGIEALVLDVKCGVGAFTPDEERARELGRVLVELAEAKGVRTIALVTEMESPLGRTVGNALEVREAIACLHGSGPADLREVTLALSAELLIGGGVTTSREEALEKLGGLLEDGRAAQRFAQLVERQGGDPRVVEEPDRLPEAPVTGAVEAAESGTVVRIDARAVGLTAVRLGAGRARQEDEIDPRVGIEIHATVGARVEPGDRLATVHTTEESKLEAPRHALLRAFQIEEEATGEAGGPPTRLLRRITADGDLPIG